MLVLAHSSSDNELPREPRRRRPRRIVWRAHTEGFATIAYRDGRAIAGISGPWAQQYVLIWWQPAQPIREVQVFDSLDDAKQAVALGGTGHGSHLEALLEKLRREHAIARPTWLRRVSRWLTRPLLTRPATDAKPTSAERARRADEITDLRGLNFRAVR